MLITESDCALLEKSTTFNSFHCLTYSIALREVSLSTCPTDLNLRLWSSIFAPKFSVVAGAE